MKSDRFAQVEAVEAMHTTKSGQQDRLLLFSLSCFQR